MREEIIFDFIQELSVAMYGKVMYFKNDDGSYSLYVDEKKIPISNPSNLIDSGIKIVEEN